MKIRATVRLRNNAMLVAREKLGLSQVDLAKKLGISKWVVVRLESLNYPVNFPETTIVKLAITLGISPDDIMPESLCGHRVETEFHKVSEVEPNQLITMRNSQRFILPSPLEEIVLNEAKEDVRELITDNIANLSFKERETIKLRFGIGEDSKEYQLKEIGKILGISGERVRQIETKALRKMAAALKSKEYNHVKQKI